MDLGVCGYILKDSAIFEIVNSIKAVAECKYFVTSSLTSFLIGRRSRTREFEQNAPELARLTATERRVGARREEAMRGIEPQRARRKPRARHQRRAAQERRR